MEDDQAIQFWHALVSEIKAEMGRQGLSSRALGRRMNVNPQFVSSRLNGGNPRTGELVVLNVRDLSAMAQALGLSEVSLVERAETAIGAGTVIHGRFGRPGQADAAAGPDLRYDPELDAVAHDSDGEPTDEQ